MDRQTRKRVVFSNREEAGRALVEPLRAANLVDPVILALPRGGIPVAVELARALSAPLDLVLVRKIGAPGNRELAAAAVVDGGAAEIVINDEVVGGTGATSAYIEAEAARELAEIERRRKAYLGNRPRIPLRDRTLILVDDGIATGTTIRAAIAALRRQSPRRMIVAVPVAARQSLRAIRGQVDDIVCLATPEPLYAIGEHYRDFHQLDDAEVLRLMASLDAPA